ncbi:MAG: Qat anti-phage system ATPase QatA [Phycisphaerales bacterium]
MILSDNETKIDLLNAEPIAVTIADLLAHHAGVPVTIGIHGDWGAGKSSVLEMLAHAIEQRAKSEVLCIRINGWSFQGFEDAKIALIEAIVAALVAARPLSSKAKGVVKDLYHRINWLKAAKMAGTFAITATTGIPAAAIVESVVGALRDFAADPAKLATPENVQKALTAAESILSPAETKHAPQEIQEFRREFDQLLVEAQIRQLVVLVDDLDRCLPETAIETLEAIRLFVFSEKTAFVIAADEAMIEYAVRRHFPGLPDSSGPLTYARNYLEKLIQVPFRIPALGVTETRIYVTLMLVGASVAADDAGFVKLIATARERLRRPWEGRTISEADVKTSFGGLTDPLREAVWLSEQIGPVLADGAKGNPRQLKRFVNTLLLRLQAAKARGFQADIKSTVLAKLMLAERFQPTFFDQIGRLASAAQAGTVTQLAELEQFSPGTGDSKGAAKKPERPSKSDAVETWLKDEAIVAWSKVQPPLGAENLQPYLFLTKDRRGYFAGLSVLGHLSEIAETLMGSSMAVRALDADLKQLSPAEIGQLFDIVAERVRVGGEFSEEPAGMAGLRTLTKLHVPLQARLLDLLEGLPKERLGTWAVAGWGGIIQESAATTRLNALILDWAQQDKNKGLAMAAAAVGKVASVTKLGRRP